MKYFTECGLMLLVGCGSGLCAQNQYPILDPFKATVKVTVGGAEHLKPEVSSYLMRELRSIPSVEIADSLHDYEVSLVALPLGAEGARERGIAIAYLVTRVRHAEKQTGLRASIAPSMLQVFDTLYKETHIIEKFGLLKGAPEDAQSLCRKLVAQIDAEVLEPDRRWLESLQKKLREAQKAPPPQTR